MGLHCLYHMVDNIPKSILSIRLQILITEIPTTYRIIGPQPNRHKDLTNNLNPLMPHIIVTNPKPIHNKRMRPHIRKRTNITKPTNP